MTSQDSLSKLEEPKKEVSSFLSPNSKRLLIKKGLKIAQKPLGIKRKEVKPETESTIKKKPVLKKTRSTKITSFMASPKVNTPKNQFNIPSARINKSSSKIENSSTRSLKFSLSPKSSCCLLEEIEFPIKPAVALGAYKSDLTMLEQSEILKYSEIYYIGTITHKLPPKMQSENFGYDDTNSDYLLVKTDHIAYRYEILSLLGRGSFGQVCECFDHKKKEKVAVKVIKNKKKFHHQAKVEIRILQSLRENNPDDTKNIIKMHNFFMFRNHVCIVFELVSISLYEFLRLNSFQGISMGLIRCFTKQILTALDYTSSLDVVHCDVKPENILLVDSQKAQIKLIDFGSSCFTSERLHTYIQSRFYRAPEIILGIPYTAAIDMWSLGCMLVELFTGQPLWPGESELDQLLLIISYLGMPSEDILAQSLRKSLFFEGNSLKRNKLSSGEIIEPGQKCLRDTLKSCNPDFFNFVQRCLDWDPQTRLFPSAALSHSWISHQSIKSQAS